VHALTAAQEALHTPCHLVTGMVKLATVCRWGVPFCSGEGTCAFDNIWTDALSFVKAIAADLQLATRKALNKGIAGSCAVQQVR
jgi:hypothetical protein